MKEPVVCPRSGFSARLAAPAGHVASRRLLALALALTITGCASHPSTTARAPSEPSRSSKVVRSAHGAFDGKASFYSPGTYLASSVRLAPTVMTAAHRTLPFGTRVRVSDPGTGRSVVVVINDRGPFVPGRVLDLSAGAARALGIERRGVSRIHADVLATGSSH